MRRLSEIKGEEAIDVLAEIMTPVSSICGDEKVKKTWESRDKNLMAFVQIMFKNHKDALVDVLCILDGSTRKEYLKSATVISIVEDAFYVMNDPVMKELFIGQGQMLDDADSGSAMESVESGN